MKSYVYLATPYSVNAPNDTREGRQLRRDRHDEALRYTADYSKVGEVIFSPIVHSHPMSIEHNMPGTWDFWSKIDYCFIDNCEVVRVIMMPEWDKSVGIGAEVEYAKKIGKPVEYVEYVGRLNQS